MFYGDKMYRVRKDAEKLIADNPDRFFLPENSLIMSDEDYKKALKISEKFKR
jgi:hypothetical protein